MNEVTQILNAIEGGDPHAADQLLPLVYDELRKLAAQKMSQEKPGHTLEATALVHEAFVRLVDTSNEQHWNGAGHFFAAAAEAMRRILVENARRKKRIKHGGDREREAVDLIELPTRMPSNELLALHEALERLEQTEPVKAQLVMLRYFAGMTIEQSADVLSISRVTAHRYWTFARAWLFKAMSEHSESE